MAEINPRRAFLKGMLVSLSLLPATASARQRYSTPLTTNRLRPPGAVSEEHFVGNCIRCGRCVEVCPYRCIRPLDLRAGVNAGTPMIDVEQIPCYLCMKCVDVCPTGALRKVSQEQTRMGVAVVDIYSCVSWQEKILCRTCYSVCPFMDRAIKLEQFKPVIDERFCTGCGLCTHACPISQEAGSGKAINIEPIYARTFALPETEVSARTGDI
ncbi:MAG: 4Fe-4S dicluster domain-containing protein [Desulfuromonas sp.]|nr:4Fe-4S dicluster domain-containing protein [Desulfuromonas sp.]